MKKFKFTLITALAVVCYSCDLETDLEVQNVESPTSLQIGVESTADKLVQSWYNTVHSPGGGPGLGMATMADASSCSWGNFGMRDLSSEPRVEWNNFSTYTNSGITEGIFNSAHAYLADSNSIIAGLESGEIPFSDPDKYESLGKFGQASALGYLALIFDRVYASDETGALNDGEPVGYQEATQIALSKLDDAIAAADRGDFTLESQVFGKSYSSEQWSQFLNTLAARLLVNSARNSAERTNLDWNRVLNYANNGLTYDFNIGMDGWINWTGGWWTYAVYPGWARVDLRIISLMDEEYPSYWPAGQNQLPPASSDDSRLTSDFKYLSNQAFPENRGIYHWTNYQHARLDPIIASGWTSDFTEMYQAENELYKAEAHLRLGNLQEAAAAINGSSRTLRGNLPPVAEDANAIADAIHYERMIELMNSGMGLAFFEMRGNDLLQEGTLKHFPIPGRALDAAGVPIYTFGGTTGTPGVDYSNGGWR